MKTFGLLFIVFGLVALGSVIVDKFDSSRNTMEYAVVDQTSCSHFTEFECIAKSGCSPVYDANSQRLKSAGLPSREQGMGLNKVNLGALFLKCVPDGTVAK